MKVSFEKRILAGFLLSGLVLLFVSFVSFNNGEKLRDTSLGAIEAYDLIYEFEQILLAGVNAETGCRGYIISGKENFLEPFYAAKKELQLQVDKLKQNPDLDTVDKAALGQIISLSEQHFQFFADCIEIRKQSFDGAVEMVSSEKGKVLLDQIRAIVRDVKSRQKTILERRITRSADEYQSFIYTLGILTSIIMLMLGVIYTIVTRNIQALRKAEAEATSKNWSLSGGEKLIQKLQGNMTPSEIAAGVIEHLGSYADIPAGAFYTVEPGSVLKLAASYMLNQSSIPVVVPFGGGICGQCALEKKQIELKDVDRTDFHIDTVFGRMHPKTILGIPIVFEDKVVAVLELGSFNAFTPNQHEYIQYISSNIAIAVLAAKAREEVKQLLEETQRQSEELEAQQEELKQTNEELHVKTEQLERSEVELKAQQLQLQSINAELEEKASTLEEQKYALEIAKSEIEVRAAEIASTSKYKSEFMANMSHELRTPLNSILILSQLLAENKNNTLANKDIEFAKNIHKSGTDLLNLINDILDLSKIEAGKLELDISAVVVSDLLESAQSVFFSVAHKNEINFNVRVEQDLEKKIINTDRQRLDQILKNLLSNAFKFTQAAGNVNIEVRRASIATINGKGGVVDAIAFAVTDTGIGIPVDKQRIIFEAFHQADGSTKRKYGGTGLGLSISKELALALGGSIRVESKEGEGSCFTLTIPLNYTLELASSDTKIIELKENTYSTTSSSLLQVVPEASYLIDDRDEVAKGDRVILIIEDDLQFAEVLKTFVRERKYKAIIATNGIEGLSLARQFKPDAIILDINLPAMNGVEVLTQLKRDPSLRHIPVQVISGYDYRKPTLELGAFDFIKKPVAAEEISSILERVESFKKKKHKKLLVVEDNELQNNAICELISGEDVSCSSAYLGNEAYAMLQNETYDCLIVDLGLPDMTGFEFLEKVKVSESLKKIPVIVYTGRDLQKDEIMRLDKLADTVVLKTADSLERVFDETTLFLHRVESRLPREKQNILRKLHRSDVLLKDKTVLLVDDDMRNIYALTNVLEDEGMNCIVADNGRIAIDVLKQNPNVDLILMDVMMPEMDGYEATREIRKDERFKKLPIIALTAKAMKGDREKCLSAGMSDYMSKPVNATQLLALMRVWLYK